MTTNVRRIALCMAGQKSQEKQALKGQDPCMCINVHRNSGGGDWHWNFVWPARE